MAHFEVREPRLGMGGGAYGLEYAIAVIGTGLGEVEVPIAFVVGTADAPKVSAELFVPSGNKVFGEGLDAFDLVELGLENCRAANDAAATVEAELLEDPSVADELGTEVPLLRPVCAGGCAESFVVHPNRAGEVGAEKVHTADVEEGAAPRVFGKAVLVEGNGECVFESRFAVRLRIGLNVVGEWGGRS